MLNTVFRRFSAFTTRNLGIIPTSKSMVNIMKNVTALLPYSCFLDSGYAQSADINTLMDVPATV